jgi:hypothetical protein
MVRIIFKAKAIRRFALKNKKIKTIRLKQKIVKTQIFNKDYFTLKK